jgi:hypothetical protein
VSGNREVDPENKISGGSTIHVFLASNVFISAMNRFGPSIGDKQKKMLEAYNTALRLTDYSVISPSESTRNPVPSQSLHPNP